MVHLHHVLSFGFRFNTFFLWWFIFITFYRLGSDLTRFCICGSALTRFCACGSDNTSIDKVETSLERQEYFSVPRYDWCAPLSHPSSCMLVNHGPSQQSSKEEYKPWKWGATARYYTSHTKTMLPTRKSVPNSAGNWTTRRLPDDRKETQTAVVWTCFPFIRSGQNHLARHSERGKKKRQTEEEVGKQHQKMDRLGVRQVPEGREIWRKLVAKSSVVPQRPSPLRDWWWWWW